MITVVHYFKRSTIILLISLGVVMMVAWWSQQYLAVRNDIITQQTSIATDGINNTIVKDLPVQSLLNEQVFTLRSAPKSSYAQQVIGQNKGVLLPDLPVLTVTNTQLGNSALISWYNQSDQTKYDGVMIYRSSDAITPGQVIATLTVTQDGTYEDTTVSPNQTYYYAIQTFRNGANSTASTEAVTSALSPIIVVTITDSIAPLPPHGVMVTTAKDDATTLAIQWQNDSTDTVVKNTIYRSSTAGEIGEKLATVAAPITEWLDATAELGVVYYYTVSASDEAGNESSINLPVAPHGNATPFIATIQ